MTAEYKNNISFIIEVINCSELAFHQKIVWFESVAIGKLEGDRQADKTKKVVILIFFFPQLSAAKYCKDFLSSCETVLSSEIFSLHFKAKRCTGNKRLLPIDWCGKGHVQTLHGMTSCKCLKQLSLTTELNMIMKVIILPTLIYICYNHSSEFRVDLHYSQNLAFLHHALENLLFYIFRTGLGNWSEANNFVIVALYFIKFNYWFKKMV